MNFGPLAILFGGGVRDDFEPPEYGIQLRQRIRPRFFVVAQAG
jgi:hypothetical protein